MQLNSLDDVFAAEINDLYSAEQQLVQALPKLAAAASSEELRKAFQTHFDETRNHVQRLEQVFADSGISRTNHACEAMQGLIQEGEEIIEADGDPTAIDAALIGAAQRVEHYEIAGYGTARALAGELGHDDSKSLLDDTLGEEGHANDLLTKLAEGGMLRSGINKRAV